MDKNFLKETFGWGFILWLIGYTLGFVLFFLVSPNMIGWIIMPIGIFVTIGVLLKKVRNNSFGSYVLLAAIWILMAIVLDYFLLVKLLDPDDGYYKLDVYVYYTTTFLLPVIVWWYKNRRSR